MSPEGCGTSPPSRRRSAATMAEPATSARGRPSPGQPGVTSISSIRYSGTTSTTPATCGCSASRAISEPLDLYGETTRCAPARLSFRSDSSPLARATIVRSGRSSRAVNVMKTFSASESTQAIKRTGTLDPGLPEKLLVRGLACEVGGARRRGRVEALGVVVDDEVLRPCRPQVSHDLAAHPAEATDEVMVRERVDHPLPPALVEKAGNVPGNEELRHRDERVEERTDAEDDQHDLEDLPARRLRRRDRADGRDRVERPDETNPERGVLGDGEAEHAGDEEQADDDPELRKPAQEQQQLPPRLSACRWAAGGGRLRPDLPSPGPRKDASCRGPRARGCDSGRRGHTRPRPRSRRSRAGPPTGPGRDPSVASRDR